MDLQLPIELVLTIIGAVVVVLTGWFAVAGKFEKSIAVLRTDVALIRNNTSGIHDDLHRVESVTAEHTTQINALKEKLNIIEDRQIRG